MDITQKLSNKSILAGTSQTSHQHLTQHNFYSMLLFLQKYVGRIEFLGDKEKLVKGDFTSLEYNIFFPSNTPIPNLLQLRVNEKVLCNGLPRK